MTPQMVLDLGRDTLVMISLLAGPVLGAGLLAGLVVSVFQAVTQIHEMTLTFIPKILAVAVALIIFAPWMLNLLLGFTTTLFLNLGTYAR